MKIKLSKWQYEVAQDKHRFRIVCSGRRSGKSTLAILITFKWAIEKAGLYWIVSPTIVQSKQIFWRQIQRILPFSVIEKKNEVERSIILKKNGSIIELKGAENPDALRGVKLRGLIIDEIASIRNWDWLWSEVLRPTLTDYEAPALFISTPKGYNHFYNLFQQGQEVKNGNVYKSWRFTSYDNPYISKEEIDNAKQELTEDTFHQEYMADFRKYTGLVYKGFDRQTHIIEPFDIPDSWSIYGGIDFGSTNPTACLWLAVDGDDNWFIVDEHYDTNQTIDFHAGRINTKMGRTFTQMFGDPSGAQWIQEFAQRGIYITPANKETGQSQEGWVRFGIEKIAERLKLVPGHVVASNRRIRRESLLQIHEKGNPKLFVFSNCSNTIKEFETYRWKEKKVNTAQDLNEPDMPEKANDHAMDALRYFAVSYKKQKTWRPLKDYISLKNWNLT